MDRQRRWTRASVLAAVTVVTTILLTGCVASGPSASSTKTAQASTTASGSATPRASATPTMIAAGTAKANLPYFDYVNKQLILKLGTPHGRDFIDNLVAAGFTKADMEVTPDTTSVGLNADNIQFSIAFHGSCLIGQYGDVGYVGIVAPELGTGKCLIGKTRPIDW